MPFGVGANPGPANKGQVYLRIEVFEFYAGMAMGPRADEAKFVLDLREYRMSPLTIPEQQTAMDAIDASLAAGELAADLGAIKGQAYGG